MLTNVNQLYMVIAVKLLKVARLYYETFCTLNMFATTRLLLLFSKIFLSRFCISLQDDYTPTIEMNYELYPFNIFNVFYVYVLWVLFLIYYARQKVYGG